MLKNLNLIVIASSCIMIYAKCGIARPDTYEPSCRDKSDGTGWSVISKIIKEINGEEEILAMGASCFVTYEPRDGSHCASSLFSTCTETPKEQTITIRVFPDSGCSGDRIDTLEEKREITDASSN